jgi:hypothetical protein
VARDTTSDYYEAMEPKINSGEVELLEVPTLSEQLTGLVMKGAKVIFGPGKRPPKRILKIAMPSWATEIMTASPEARTTVA